MVGVDDFAWTKRRGYGTILVDLETHRLLALLADCEADTVAAWFRRHPSVQIVTRDRSPTFADAIRRGAPHALHIADRFQLHMNAMTCLETLLTREQATVRRVVATLRADHRKAQPAPSPRPLAPQRQRSERGARRYARYEQVIQRPPRMAGHSERLPRRAQWPPSVRGNPGGISYPAGLTEVYVALQRLLHTGTNSQPGPRQRGATVSVVLPQANGCQLLFKAKRTTQEQRFVQSLLEQSALIARTYESVRRFRQILDLPRRDRFAILGERSRGV